MAIAAPPGDRRLLLPIGEVSELTGVSVKLLKREAPAKRIGRLWLVPRSWVTALVTWPEPEDVAS